MSKPSNKIKPGFKAMVAKFPKAELPLQLQPDTVRKFEKENKPLSQENIRLFLIEEGEEYDEFAEWVPCCRLPDTKFHGLVYWQAGLMEYHYILVTFDRKGNLINKKRIGGTIPDNNTFKVIVPTIENSWKIDTEEGNISQQDSLIPKKLTAQYQFTISEEGIIQ